MQTDHYPKPLHLDTSHFMNEKPVSKWVLPVIVIAQFACTSLWFAGNAVLPDLLQNMDAGPGFLANLTSAVQFGFITGTLVFALLTIADRFSPSRVFFACSIFAALCNLAIIIPALSPAGLFISRLFTGFFLAGIYPVGMKIASDHYKKGLGRSLGFLVGALVLGTAFPHFLKSITVSFPWEYVVFSISALSVTGGWMILRFVPDGPFRKQGQPLKPRALMSAFADKNFRAAAFGYFGHMWELYTFWAFVPVILHTNEIYQDRALNIPFLSFAIIASGSIACVAGGLISQRFGAKKIAAVSLFLSGCCCLLSPLFVLTPSAALLVSFLIFWGLVVVADSPLFSTLVAQNVPEQTRGTSLTLVNCIGFSITIISIQVIKIVSPAIDGRYIYMLLAIGPLAGLIALFSRKASKNSQSRY